MNGFQRIWLKAILSILTLVIISAWDTPAHRKKQRAGGVLIFLAALSILNYYNFGMLHGSSYSNYIEKLPLRSIHYWEQFHHYLGAKYFPELGYDGLYVASIAAQQESDIHYPQPSQIRDLRNYENVAPATLSEHQDAVKARFTAERWQAFVNDHQHFLSATQPSYMEKIRLDHGFNATPTWVFLAQLFNRWLPASWPVIFLLSQLDTLLLSVMFFVIARTYGSRKMCLSMIIFGMGYAWRFDWVGGAFLRMDWLAATVIGICMLKRKHYRRAGALFGLAAMLRIFPAILLFGPAVLALKALLQKQKAPWILRLALGFVISVSLCFALGCLTGAGPRAWGQFAENLQLHAQTWLDNNVGLTNLFIYSPWVYNPNWRDRQITPVGKTWQEYLNARQASRALTITAATLLTLLALAGVVWSMPLEDAASASVVALFALTLLTSYYWSILLIMPFRNERRALNGLLALNIALYTLHLGNMALVGIYGLMSWGQALVLAIWLWPLAIRPKKKGQSIET